MTVEFGGAKDVISASSCALDRQYVGRPHSECEWCKESPVDLLKSIYSWMKSPDNAGEIIRGDRGEDEAWLL